MNNVIDTFADLVTATAGLIFDHARTLAIIAGVALLLLGWHSVIHHMVTAQSSNAALFEQLTRPQPATVAVITTPQQQWIPVR